MNDSPGDLIHVAGEPRIITRSFLVTRPVAETDAQRRARRKRGEPMPEYAYTVIATRGVEA